MFGFQQRKTFYWPVYDYAYDMNNRVAGIFFN